MPSTHLSLRLMCVTSISGRQAFSLDRKAVIVRSDLHTAAAAYPYRLIPAAMPEDEFESLAAKRAAQQLMPETDAEGRRCRTWPTRRISSTSLFIEAGSPGPFERKTPSGFSANTSLPALKPARP